MNVRLLARLLGILSLLLGLFMLLSLPWAWPSFGAHTDRSIVSNRFESEGLWGLIVSSVISCVVGGCLLLLGRGAEMRLYRKEAMAVVGLSWILATVLGALPFVTSGVSRGPSVRPLDLADRVAVVRPAWSFWSSWQETGSLPPGQLTVIVTLANASGRGLNEFELEQQTGLPDAVSLFEELQEHPSLGPWLIGPGEVADAPADRASHYRLRWVKMGWIDAMFESQSGFSTTGATVICDLEDPWQVPRCILFWRALTHFLGGLGIIVLFVVLLGQGSAGKALMRAEMPGPTQESSTALMQHNAWKFAALYVGLNVVLAIILRILGMTTFDALCHSFATMATGGFSTYNASLGHFEASLADGTAARSIEYVVIVFMLLAGTNFTLLFLALFGQLLGLVQDVEFRSYVGIVVVVTAILLGSGWLLGDPGFDEPERGFRQSLFQTVSILTTTGFGTADFDSWNQLSRGVLLVCMLIGGCAGSTGGGLKVIRHVLFLIILSMEIERAFRPKVVQLLKLSGKPVSDQNLRHAILVYFGMVFFFFIVGWLAILLVEPDLTWGVNAENKLIDSASAVVATLNNIGPGLGLVGPTSNYANFSDLIKSVFVLLMMLGRLEIFPIVVLFAPSFWRDQ